jgi:uncharacterized protein (TIGR02231 family)
LDLPQITAGCAHDTVILLKGLAMFRSVVAATLLAAIAASPALAADIDLTSKIERVTVYPDGAVVTRTGKATLLAGASQVVLRGLPATIDPASIRVEGQGTAAFAIGAVDVRVVPGDARPVVDAALEAKLKVLREEREGVAGRISAATGKKAAIERFAQSGPDKLGNDGKAMPVSDWASAWDAIGSGLAKVNDELRLANTRQRDLDGEIAALERARPPAPRPGAPKRDVVIAIEAAGPATADLAISYRISGAGWQPAYEAKLVTGTRPKVELSRRAEVRNSTGEDWSDVALNVSTVRAARGTAAPELLPVQISFFDPELYARRAQEMAASTMRQRSAPKPMMAPGVAADAEKREAAPAPEPVQAEITTATLEAGAFQASFAVPGKVTLSADGSMKALTLSQRSFDPSLLARTTPELDATAYLEAAFINEEEAPLLPGTVALHRDGTFIGRGRIGLVAPGDKVELGFGADDRIIVKRAPVKRRENEPGWLGQSKTDVREFRTLVRNLHPVPMKITVTDRLPYTENTAITVEQLPQTTPPTEKQVGDRRGVISWTFDAAPGSEKDIRLAYRLKWPGDREVRFEQK